MLANISFSYYLENLSISLLVMNVIAGFYYVMVRFVEWHTLGDANLMERQGTVFLVFCSTISLIHALEVDQGNNFLGWLIVMGTQILIGVSFALIANRFYR